MRPSYFDGRWRVNASSVSYRWLSASKIGMSSPVTEPPQGTRPTFGMSPGENAIILKGSLSTRLGADQVAPRPPASGHLGGSEIDRRSGRASALAGQKTEPGM